MSKQAVTCVECENEYVVDLYGEAKRIEWKVEHWRETCPDCKDRELINECLKLERNQNK